MVRGFFKVTVLAVLLQALHQDALAQMWEPSPVTAKLYPAFRLALVYPLFLYANFSGYIDIVIAIARLMRLRLPENFDRPFSATSFLEFWSRWHITLSNWLKTYVYNPLLVALMRRISSPVAEPFLGVTCFFVTFFLVGLWHGRTFEFVFFGLLQGGGVAMNKVWQLGLTSALGRKGYKALANNPVYNAFARGLTFSWFAFTLFWFWSKWQQIDRLFAAVGLVRWVEVWLVVWLSATLTLSAWESLRTAILSIRTSDGPVFQSRYARVVYASALGFIAFAMTALLKQPAPEIVYKGF
jgi:D-alanyl-lipoteichoic acid acyltransferase DltB (MBOAT superfamily)